MEFSIFCFAQYHKLQTPLNLDTSTSLTFDLSHRIRNNSHIFELLNNKILHFITKRQPYLIKCTAPISLISEDMTSILLMHRFHMNVSWLLKLLPQHSSLHITTTPTSVSSVRPVAHGDAPDRPIRTRRSAG